MNVKKAGYTAAAILIAAALSGCGGASSNADEGNEEKKNENPALSVYNTPSPERIEFILKPGNLETGTKVRVSAYNGGFDNAAPGCNGAETSGTDMVINEKSELKGSLSQPGVGNVRLVITAPGYASSCDGTENTLSVKWAPGITINATDRTPGAEPIKTPAANEKFTLAIFADIVSRSTFKDNFWTPMTIKAHGPYVSIPELQAAGCPEDAPIAGTLSSELNFAPAGTGQTPPLEMSVTTPGVYWFSAEIEGSDRSLEARATTCDGDVSEAVVIVK